jgi:hypothetical protein
VQIDELAPTLVPFFNADRISWPHTQQSDLLATLFFDDCDRIWLLYVKNSHQPNEEDDDR